ncbi:MAG: hypothetical protein UT33_C0011G0188 [Candidatus Peregrinibacteria bacterium GW2011_GWC2_39_14]|nr:MAG: hypothetical protein UT33_C0011G0188 [Candidatus Peregrinibacteria bacterium GW2011_GWC2_39_14]
MDKTKQFISEMKKIRLTQNEKMSAQTNIISHMEKNPIGNTTSFWTRIGQIFMPTQHKKAFIAIYIIILVFGGSTGTAFAAETSLPGDLLYPIKTNVNEEIRSRLTFSKQRQAEWEATRIQKRLGEIKELEQKGTISKDQIEKIKAKIEQQTEKAKEKIEALKTSGDSENAEKIIEKLETSLKDHEKVLEKLNDENTSTQEIKETVRDLKVITFPKQAAENKLENANKKIEKIQNFIEKNHDKMPEESFKQAQGKLIEAEQKIQEGNAAATSEDFKSAFESFKEAHKMANEIKPEIKDEIKSEKDAQEIEKPQLKEQKPEDKKEIKPSPNNTSRNKFSEDDSEHK